MIKTKCKDILRNGQQVVTQSRCDVLCILSKSQHPMSVAELKQTLGKSSPNVVTIYRMLESFLDKGIVRRVPLRSSEALFEFTGFGDHHHISCIECHKIEEVDDCAVSGALKNALKKSNKFASITQHTFELYGVCKECTKKK
jgi:Fur family ferric uptake transcriptional regulator